MVTQLPGFHVHWPFHHPARHRPAAAEPSVARGSLVAAIVRAGLRHRLTGHAAETAYYATLALVPGTVIVSTTINLMARAGGPVMQAHGRETVIQVIRFLIGPKLTDTVVAPFVLTQLTQPAGGITIGSAVLAWWMFSHLFTAAGHALDVAYGIEEHRRTVPQRIVALLCVLAAISIATVTLVLMVALEQSGHSTLLAVLAQIRWPILLVIMVGVFLALYHLVPSNRHPAKHCLPGAVVGVLLWAGAASLFRLYVYLGAADPTGVAARDPRVVLIGKTVGAVVGTAIFMYLSVVAVLLGAELNAELDRRREGRLVADYASEAPLPSRAVPAVEDRRRRQRV